MTVRQALVPRQHMPNRERRSTGHQLLEQELLARRHPEREPGNEPVEPDELPRPTLDGGTPGGGEDPGDQAAAQAVAVRRPPACRFDRVEPAAAQRHSLSNRQVEQRSMSRGHGCEFGPGGALEQGRGAFWIRPHARIRPNKCLNASSDPYHQDDRAFWGNHEAPRAERGGRPRGSDLLEPIAPIEATPAATRSRLGTPFYGQPALDGERVGERARRKEREGLDLRVRRRGA